MENPTPEEFKKFCQDNPKPNDFSKQIKLLEELQQICNDKIEQLSPYGLKVYELATTLAKTANNFQSAFMGGQTFLWEDQSIILKEKYIAEWIPTAKDIIAKMAEEYHFGYMSNFDGDPDEDVEEIALWESNCNSEMSYRGLIPEEKTE